MFFLNARVCLEHIVNTNINICTFVMIHFKFNKVINFLQRDYNYIIFSLSPLFNGPACAIGQSGEASRWRVCYQRGLPRLVFLAAQTSSRRLFVNRSVRRSVRWSVGLSFGGSVGR